MVALRAKNLENALRDEPAFRPAWFIDGEVSSFKRS
jgi:hypothetical protein